MTGGQQPSHIRRQLESALHRTTAPGASSCAAPPPLHPAPEDNSAVALTIRRYSYTISARERHPLRSELGANQQSWTVETVAHLHVCHTAPTISWPCIAIKSGYLKSEWLHLRGLGDLGGRGRHGAGIHAMQCSLLSHRASQLIPVGRQQQRPGHRVQGEDLIEVASAEHGGH